MTRYLMECGHVANAEKIDPPNNDRKPVCAICDCDKIVKEARGADELEGRQAVCSQHKGCSPSVTSSRWELPFFNYRPDEKYDTYYCGCWGWD